MTKYLVTWEDVVTFSCKKEIEANSPEEAIEKAKNITDDYDKEESYAEFKDDSFDAESIN